jgi:hypothetical protein
VHFDAEGHIIVSPREIHELALKNKTWLINSVLIPGTPCAIPTHALHHELLQYISDRIGIHPSYLFFKGSTKIGFSIAPKATKVWMKYGPASDLDLAIVDPHFFQMVDSEVRRWEWGAENRGKIFQNQRLGKEYRNRNKHKGKFDCFRFFDLPKIACMEELDDCLRNAPVEACSGEKRSLKAFIFRDWWGICKRYDYDLYCLTKGLRRAADPLPAGGDDPRPYEEVLDSEPDEPEPEEHYTNAIT